MIGTPFYTEIFGNFLPGNSVAFDFPQISGNFGGMISLFGNSTICGFSATVPRIFSYHLSRFEIFGILIEWEESIDNGEEQK